MHRFNKLNFIFLAVALLIAPLALNAQKTSTDKWSGVHVGVIGGTAAGNYNLHASSTSSGSEDIDSSLAGGRVGVQGGVDFHVKGLVVGAVADWSWADARMKFDISSTSGGGSLLDGKVKQMTTVRARVGKRYGHVLPYVHGGLLVADTELGSDVALFTGSTTVSKVHAGFVVGGGLEYALARHYSVTTEYGYNHVSNVDVTTELGGNPSAGDRATLNPHFSTLTVGFNYRF